jgi:hypothetical protein
MDSFDTNKILPQNILIDKADYHLYRISLNLISNRPDKKSNFHNPLLIFSVNIALVIKSIIALLIPEENENLLKMIGNFAHFFLDRKLITMSL